MNHVGRVVSWRHADDDSDASDGMTMVPVVAFTEDDGSPWGVFERRRGSACTWGDTRLAVERAAKDDLARRRLAYKLCAWRPQSSGGGCTLGP